jgi:outer membrane receptor protein involved in Fe transport
VGFEIMFTGNALRQRLTIALLMASIVLTGGNAMAQDAEGQEAGILEEVIVTAQKREQNLQDISISIKALNAETLQTIRADSLDDIVRIVPSLSMTDISRGGNNVQIRGLGSNVANVGTVAIYNDGVISANRIQSSGTFAEQDSALYDVERVEVLRGPQGTLYGEGSFGGVINIISKQPDAEMFSASASATWSDTKGATDYNWDLAAMINIPIVKDTLALRVVGFSNDHAGYIDAVNVLPLFFGAPPEFVGENLNTEDVTGGRALLRWTPTDKFAASFIYKSQETDIGISNFDSPNLIGLVNLLAGTSYEPEFTQAIFDSTYGSTNETDEGILTLDFETGIGILTSITGWGDVEQVNANGLYAQSDAFSQELRLASLSDGNLNWIVGAFYRSVERDINFTDFPFNSNEMDQWSIFGQLYWHFADKWMATFGLRYGEHDTKSTDKLLGLPTVSADFDDVSPKLALDYSVNDEVMIYGSIAKGFRAGGTNTDESFGTDPTFNLSFEPDEVWNYELGLKSTFWQDKAVLNTAIFYVDWKDIQVDKAIESLISPPYQFIVTNGEDAHSFGIEADMYLYPAEGWEIVLGGALLESEFDNGTIDTATAGLGVPLKGNKLASAPEYMFNISVEKKWHFEAGSESFVRLDYMSRGNSFADVPNEAPPGGSFRSGKLTNLNLRAGFRSENWSMQAFVTNVTDEYVSTFNFFDGGFGDVHVVLRPRTYGINFNYFYN